MVPGHRIDQKVHMRNVLLEPVEHLGPSDLELSLRHGPCAQCRGQEVSPPPRMCCAGHTRTARPSVPRHWSRVTMWALQTSRLARERSAGSTGRAADFFFFREEMGGVMTE